MEPPPPVPDAEAFVGGGDVKVGVAEAGGCVAFQ